MTEDMSEDSGIYPSIKKQKKYQTILGVHLFLLTGLSLYFIASRASMEGFTFANEGFFPSYNFFLFPFAIITCLGGIFVFKNIKIARFFVVISIYFQIIPILIVFLLLLTWKGWIDFSDTESSVKTLEDLFYVSGMFLSPLVMYIFMKKSSIAKTL